MGLIGEAFIVVCGLCYIVYHFSKNLYHHGYDVAKEQSGFHIDGVLFVLEAFVDVFVKGKTEEDLIGH